MNAQEKQRIDYVDLLKGFAMVMVIVMHCGINLPDCISEQFKLFRMPLYFFLAGMFVTGRRPTAEFTAQKLNRLIIPGIFFGLIYFICIMTLSSQFSFETWLTPIKSTGILTPIYYIYQYLTYKGNFVIWFLWCMFLATVIFHIIVRHTSERPQYVRAISVLFCAAAGIWLMDAHNSLSFGFKGLPYSGPIGRLINYSHLGVAMAMSPIMYAGYIAAAHKMHQWQPTTWQVMTIMIICGGIGSLAMVVEPIELIAHQWNIKAYIPSLAMIMFFVTLAKLIGRVRILNYIGQNSIIAMGTHILYMTIFLTCFPELYNRSLILMFVLTLTLLSIYPLRRWVPWLTGYADLIRPVKPWRVFSVAKG